MSSEQDIIYGNQESNSINKLEVNESSAAINDNQGEQDNYYYDEIDRKCTLRKNNTGSKIIIHRSRTKYKGKKLFDISIGLLGVIGLLLIIFYIIILVRGGWSKSNIHDVSSGNKITLILVGIFVIFVSFIGMLGSYTYWKPIILMTSLLCALAFVSHFYLAKKFLDISRFAHREMAIQWWDTYTDENIIAIEEEYGCCGFLNYKDKGYISANCPSELVVYEVPEEIHYVASVKKSDSYQKKFGTPDNPKNVEDASDFTGASTTITTDETTNTSVENTGVDNNANDTPNADDNTTNPDTTNPDNENVEGQGENDETVWKKREIDIDVMTNVEQSEEAEKLKKEIDLGIARISKINNNGIGITLPIKKRGLTVVEENMEEDVLRQLGEDIKSNLNNGQGKIILSSNKQKRRYEPVFSKNRINKNIPDENTESFSTLFKRDENGSENVTIPGCKNAIVDKVKSGIAPLYIIFFITLIVYIIVFVSSIIYWLDLRKEKEYDEFS
ncbi:hypothetical protein BCR36DRAFT_411618 [Piromyces finnis]|uniref:Uncharacterized protein n=1 Tax=Piromyces finnis TaxID=1754191 RepID=A0A1Y1VBY2_9FUNG|nr:hypothetical protein BCR36DRAFT_411618 [Piromyces finnis]|eukprot:ORX52170.1 hypothetical protein BCR36DRAFT_411618 [Piromyces finnis]